MGDGKLVHVKDGDTLHLSVLGCSVTQNEQRFRITWSTRFMCLGGSISPFWVGSQMIWETWLVGGNWPRLNLGGEKERKECLD